jgi:hypothetical protein
VATTTFLANATVNMTVGMTSYDLSDQATNVTLTVGSEALEATAMGDTGRRMVAGLQSVSVELELFLSYGSNEVEAALADAVGKQVTLVISPSGTTESATNPEYTITGTYLENFTPISSAVGELSKVTASFQGGSYARDIVTP